jgi:hypothetical protein
VERRFPFASWWSHSLRGENALSRDEGLEILTEVSWVLAVALTTRAVGRVLFHGIDRLVSRAIAFDG